MKSAITRGLLSVTAIILILWFFLTGSWLLVSLGVAAGITTAVMGGR